MRIRLISGCVAILISTVCSADTLSLWTFETSIPATAGPHNSEGAGQIYVGQALGHHASGATTYSSPAGNGSNHSFSSNAWLQNDYYQFSTSSAGYQGITLSWDQMRNGLGPPTFQLSYSTGGGFTNFGGTYSVVSSPAWNSVTSTPLTSFSANLTSITALDNQANITFRLTDASTNMIFSGTDSVDNFQISGAAIVPTPLAATGGFALMSLMSLGRRRRGARAFAG